MERAKFPSLRYGRQYQRPISNFGADFALPLAGELIAWSHILDDEEALCVVNGHAGKHEAAMRPWTWLSILLLRLAIDGMGQHHSSRSSPIPFRPQRGAPIRALIQWDLELPFQPGTEQHSLPFATFRLPKYWF